MNHVHLRSVLIASMICIGLVLHPSSPAAEEQAKPQESPSHAALTAEVLQLRREVESLRQRLDLSEKNTADIPNGHGGDAGEKERLVAETQKILIHFNSGKATVWKEAHGKIRELRMQVAAALKELQDGYTRATKLDEALAIRDAICAITAGRTALPDPGALRTTSEPGRVLFFRVTGTSSGSVYGTDVYTSGCVLGTAAVHAGVLKIGQTGVVKVTTIPSHQGYVSSTRNGITSSSWGSYPGFRVEAPGDEDQDVSDGALGDAAATKAPDPSGSTELPKSDPAREGAAHSGTPDEYVPGMPAMPANLPAEARQLTDRFSVAAAAIRKCAREEVARLTAEAVERLAPIRDAHTRAARLDEAVAVRDLIRKLTE